VTARRFPIEAGHIMMFARALGDPNPIYYGGDDLVAERPNVIAPPTFAEASMHYDPDFPLRPRIGQVWFGSGRYPSGGSAPVLTVDSAQSGGTSFHAETHLEYFGLLRPGDVLDVSTHEGRCWEKHGARGGRLRFSERITEFSTDQDLIVRSTTVGVRTEHKLDTAGALPQKRSDDTTTVRSDPVTTRIQSYPVRVVRSSELAVGDTREMLLVSNLTRGQILMYAGASGDFSPQHTDELWNTQVAGYPTIFAHGMLTMGMTGRLLTDWFGNGTLRQFGTRFSRQVWPGDTLTALAVIEKIETRTDTALVRLVIATRNGRGDPTTTGYATVELVR